MSVTNKMLFRSTALGFWHKWQQRMWCTSPNKWRATTRVTEKMSLFLIRENNTTMQHSSKFAQSQMNDWSPIRQNSWYTDEHCTNTYSSCYCIGDNPNFSPLILPLFLWWPISINETSGTVRWSESIHYMCETGKDKEISWDECERVWLMEWLK